MFKLKTKQPYNASCLMFVLMLFFAFQGGIEAQNADRAVDISKTRVVYMVESKYEMLKRNSNSPMNIAMSATIHEIDNPNKISTKTYAEFPGGKEAREKFMAEHMVCPPKIEQFCLSGIIGVTFFVEKDGTLSEPNIVSTLIVAPDDKKSFTSYPGEDPATNFEEAALNVVKQMPKWTPTVLQNDQTVRSEVRLQMTFEPKTSRQ